MGCWGITAFESDAGLDAVGVLRTNLPKDGKMELEKLIDAMKQIDWCVPDTADGNSHTGPMALAEVVVKFIDGDIGDLDYDEEWAADDNKFNDLTSFTTDKDSVRWLRDYLADTLKNTLIIAEFRAQHGTVEWDKRGGWREESLWCGWQGHMQTLVDRMDALLAMPTNQIELMAQQEQSSGPIMNQTTI